MEIQHMMRKNTFMFSFAKTLLLMFLVANAWGSGNGPSREELSSLFEFIRANKRISANSSENIENEELLSKAQQALNSALFDKHQTRLDGMKALTNARHHLKWLVIGCYNAFDHAFYSQKEVHHVGGFSFNSMSLPTYQDLYPLYKPFFDTHVKTLRAILGEEKYQAMLRQPHGVDTELSIGWVREYVEGQPSIVPFFAGEKGTSGFFSFLYGERFYYEPTHAPILATSALLALNEASRQRGVALINGRIIDQPGIYMHRVEGDAVKFFGYHGAPSFATEKRTCSQGIATPFMRWYLANLPQQDQSPERINEILRTGTLFPLPNSPEDDILFQAALMEAMAEMEIDHSQTATPTPHFLITMQGEKDSSKSEPTEALQSPSHTSLLQQKADELYMEYLHREWEKRQKNVAEGCVVGKPQKPTPKKGKKLDKHVQKDLEPTPSVFTPDPRAIEEIRQKGRLKYRHVARLIAETLKNKREEVCINVVKVGSHFNMHITTPSGQRKGVTLLKLHAGDRTVSSNEALNLVSQVKALLNEEATK
jgi:hypothetical protein